MDDELRARFDTLERKVDAAYAASEKVRKYLFWTGVVTVAVVVLPLLALPFAISSFLSTYNSPDMQSLLQ